MPVRYVVQAELVDIRVDQPVKTDVFVVDTNVWFWVAYTKSTPLPHQRATYPLYLKNALTVQAKTLRFVLGQAELFHLIEKAECDSFIASHPGTRPKEFRHNFPAERVRVEAECRIAWQTVKGLTAPLDAMVDDSVTDAALARFRTQALDGYDLYLLEAMQNAGLRQILTDDGDFCTVPGLQVFTANQNVINLAAAQKRLLAR
jgi:predicted nucleic acid-binding protein